jgi:hypothetical protein
MKKNKKITLSISLDAVILNIIKESVSNRSKFVEQCLIEDLCKNENIRQELKDKKIIL